MTALYFNFNHNLNAGSIFQRYVNNKRRNSYKSRRASMGPSCTDESDCESALLSKLVRFMKLQQADQQFAVSSVPRCVFECSPRQGSISPTFYEQLLHTKIPKAQKRQSSQASFCTFGIREGNCCVLTC